MQLHKFDHFTGKMHEVMNARRMLRAKHHNQNEIDLYRSVMLRTVRATNEGDSSLLSPQTVAAFVQGINARSQAMQSTQTPMSACPNGRPQNAPTSGCRQPRSQSTTSSARYTCRSVNDPCPPAGPRSSASASCRAHQSPKNNNEAPSYGGTDADALGCAPDLSLSQNINYTEAMTAFVSQLPDFEFAKSVDIVSAVKGKSGNKYKKRLGAKQVNIF